MDEQRTRGNSTGQDLNRDFSLIREPETFAFVKMLRDYQARSRFDGHEFGNNQAGDLPVLYPRHLNVPEPVFNQAKDLIEGWLYAQGSVDGWWYCPYGCQGGGAVGLNQETIPCATPWGSRTWSVRCWRRAAQADDPAVRRWRQHAEQQKRKACSALNNYHEFLDYFRANQSEIIQVNRGRGRAAKPEHRPDRVRGSYDVPAFPAPHPGESPPPPEVPTRIRSSKNRRAGTYSPREQYNGPRTDGPAGLTTTLAERIEAHGWRVQTRPVDTWSPDPARTGSHPAAPRRPGCRTLGRSGTCTVHRRIHGPSCLTAPGLGRGPASPDRTPSAEDLVYVTD